WTRAPEAALLPDRLLLVADSGPEHVEQLGGVVRQPLAVGPDPLAPPGDQFAGGPAGDLIVPEPLRWMTDFDEAVKAGMGFRVPLTPRQAGQGFDRLYVVGLRLTADHDEARMELENLIQRQARSQAGFAMLRQGTPTNNAEQGSSGWSRVQEADELFDVMRASLAGVDQFDAAATEPYARRDGLILAQTLGIDPEVLQDIPNAGGTDQAEARAMNAALWPATLGYWMDTQLRPIFTPEAIERTRLHFVARVSGRGAVPAVRIGKQPYGILPTAALGKLGWLDEDDAIGVADLASAHRRFLRTLRDLLFTLGRHYWDGFAAAAPRVGAPAADPRKQLLDIVGLHPSSVEFHLDVVDSAERIWNGYSFIRKSRARLRAEMESAMAAGAAALRSLGWQGARPEILEKFFAYAHGPMNRPVIDEPPLSEVAGLTLCTDDGRNYIAWCRDAARSNLEDLRLQRGFSEGGTPNALLYHMLRHALQLGYYTAAVRLHQLAGLVTEADVSALYREPTFIHVAEGQPGAPSESRYRPLYARNETITGVAGRTVAEFIPEWLAAGGRSSALADQLAALDLLEQASTAALERAFAEHVDLCSYRWDAWVLSLVNERLAAMRGARPLGIYLGAFAWLEGLAPETASRPTVELGDDLAKVFAPAGTPLPVRDPANAGHVLAPSQNHAVTAAVLRSGYTDHADPANADLFAVDLSSARVRVALQFIEGIRNGQPLGALLGYQLERRLHDRHAEAEMDAFIYQVRKAFPLAAKRITETVEEGAETAPIEQVEARNVCDGMLLLEHVRQSPVKTYPWGKDLDPADPAEQAIIDQEVQALFRIQDAIADVAIAESVHQVTMGNAERGAAAMDAYGKGGFPPEPDVVTTPRSGLSLTHRVALHLPVDAAVPASATPRARAEPAIDAWLAAVLPPLANVVVRVTATNGPPGSVPVVLDVTVASLGLRPVDLLHLLDPGNEQAMNELDDRIAQQVIASQGLTPDAAVTIGYTVPVAGRITMFELAPLVTSLRTLLLEARPLKPSDATVPEDADPAADATVTVAAAQVTAARTAVAQLATDAGTLLATL
ncbi:MAG TPA: hypothetical protein VJ794_02885, partial [Gemmatimonadales bacterium]|nr:hypothetical protein [Gemmatimonadales bacterium]